MRATALLAALGALAGCATLSLEGIPEERRVALPEELLGKWQDIHGDEQVVLSVEPRSGGSSGVLLTLQGREQQPVEMRLAVSAIELAGEPVLCVTLADSEFPHVFCRAQLDGERLTLTFLDLDWLTGREVERGEGLIELLTAAAPESSAWEDDWTLTRGS